MPLDKFPRRLEIQATVAALLTLGGCEKIGEVENAVQDTAAQVACVEREGPPETLETLLEQPSLDGVCRHIDVLKQGFDYHGYFIDVWRHSYKNEDGLSEWNLFLEQKPGSIPVRVVRYKNQIENINLALELLSYTDAERVEKVHTHFELVQREAQLIDRLRELYFARQQHSDERYMHKAMQRELDRFSADFGETATTRFRKIYGRQVLGLRPAPPQVEVFMNGKDVKVSNAWKITNVSQ